MKAACMGPSVCPNVVPIQLDNVAWLPIISPSAWKCLHPQECNNGGSFDVFRGDEALAINLHNMMHPRLMMLIRLKCQPDDEPEHHIQ
jgi:hypothetical protein